MIDAVLEQRTGAEEVIWDLSALYSGIDDPAIERDLQGNLDAAAAFADRYRGRVATLDAEEIVDAMIEREAMYEIAYRLDAFAYLLFSVDTADSAAGAVRQKVVESNAELSQRLMFFNLEWKEIPETQTEALLANPTLGKYRYPLQTELRYRPFTLSEIEEGLLIEKSVTGRDAWSRLFTQIVSGLRFDWEGEQVTQSVILSKLSDSDRDVRRRAAESMTAGLQSRSMETSYIFNVMLADKAQDDKRRGFPSWITERNMENKAPDAVVDALIGAVTSSYDLVARHYRLKRVLLDLDELTEIDRYAPLTLDAPDTLYSWDQAREIVISAYTAFSPRMGEIASRFFDENWIHAALMPNKRGGAYAHPTVPSAHPFVFTNYTGKMSEVMYLAHELGHGLHMFLSAEAQGITGLYTPLTTAEMASVFGEMLTFTDLMRKEPDPAARLLMTASKIEGTFATVFRQVAMNRFEEAIHTARRDEGELPTERINELWMQTQRAMFGDSVNLSDNYANWWSYISHFISTPGYVYAYAFGELLVLALFNLYQQRGTDFVPQYIDILAAGDSDDPDRILAKIGIDLTDPDFWTQGLNTLREMVDQEEALARELFPDKF